MSAQDALDEYLATEGSDLFRLASMKLSTQPLLSKQTVRDSFARNLDDEVNNYIDQLVNTQRLRKQEFDRVRKLIEHDFDLDEIDIDVEGSSSGNIEGTLAAFEDEFGNLENDGNGIIKDEDDDEVLLGDDEVVMRRSLEMDGIVGHARERVRKLMSVVEKDSVERENRHVCNKSLHPSKDDLLKQIDVSLELFQPIPLQSKGLRRSPSRPFRPITNFHASYDRNVTQYDLDGRRSNDVSPYKSRESFYADQYQGDDNDSLHDQDSPGKVYSKSHIYDHGSANRKNSNDDDEYFLNKALEQRMNHMKQQETDAVRRHEEAAAAEEARRRGKEDKIRRKEQAAIKEERYRIEEENMRAKANVEAERFRQHTTQEANMLRKQNEMIRRMESAAVHAPLQVPDTTEKSNFCIGHDDSESSVDSVDHDYVAERQSPATPFSGLRKDGRKYVNETKAVSGGLSTGNGTVRFDIDFVDEPDGMPMTGLTETGRQLFGSQGYPSADRTRQPHNGFANDISAVMPRGPERSFGHTYSPPVQGQAGAGGLAGFSSLRKSDPEVGWI
jgi:hypothetical protein